MDTLEQTEKAPIFLQTQGKRGMERTDIEGLSYNVEGRAA